MQTYAINFFGNNVLSIFQREHQKVQAKEKWWKVMPFSFFDILSCKINQFWKILSLFYCIATLWRVLQASFKALQKQRNLKSEAGHVL